MGSTEIADSANAIAKELDADVIFYSGLISRARAAEFEKLIGARRRRPNVLLLLVTQGGDPDGAFRIGRALQVRYGPAAISTLIPGWCKSAGTLITLATNKLYIGDLGELGPLDIQIAKQDEIEEAASGLLVETTLRTLETTATRMFINVTRTIRRETGVTTKMASEISAKMVIGLLSPVYSQIEPLKIGENARAMNITTQYGRRLNGVSGALIGPEYLEFLVRAYPDHGFVIDMREAKAIYKDVSRPTATMEFLVTALGDKASYPPGRDAGESVFLSSEAKPTVAPAKKSGVNQHVQSPKPARGRASSRSSGSSRIIGAGAKRGPNHSNGALPTS